MQIKKSVEVANQRILEMSEEQSQQDEEIQQLSLEIKDRD
jgi:hypothetical protein